jgi:hypothetical protein
MRVKSLYAKSEHLLHRQCSPYLCKIKFIAQAKFNIDLYIKELSRVFFKKENMRHKRQWWLSTFYSFCIQSFVKICLVELETRFSIPGNLRHREYLELPLKLFIASSGTYDPLKVDWAQGDWAQSGSENYRYIVEERDRNDYYEAQVAVGRDKWAEDEISGAAEYLRTLFANSSDKAQGRPTRRRVSI